MASTTPMSAISKTTINGGAHLRRHNNNNQDDIILTQSFQSLSTSGATSRSSTNRNSSTSKGAHSAQPSTLSSSTSSSSTSFSTSSSSSNPRPSAAPSKQSTSRRPPHLPPTVSTPVVSIFDVDQDQFRTPKADQLDWSRPTSGSLGLAILLEREFAFTTQLQLRLVCRQWRSTVETLCRARRSVKFFGWAPTRLDNDELFASTRTAAAVLEPAKGAAILTRLLPNITTLGLVCTEKWQAQLLLALLGTTGKTGWGRQLERLHVRGLPKNKALESKLLTVIFRGTALPRLTALSLYGLAAHLVPVQLPLRLPALARLSTFMIEGYTGDLTPVLMQLGPPIRHLLVHAEHNSVNLIVEVLEFFLKSAPDVGASLRLLDLAVIPDRPLRLWRLVCERFRSLESLEVSFLFGVTLNQTLPHLIHLPSLAKLNFNVDLKKEPTPALANLGPLPQLKTLFLGAVAQPSFDVAVFRDTFGRLFPAIEELRIATFSPLAVKEFSGEVKHIFPNLRRHQIGLANRSRMEVGVEKKVYRKAAAVVAAGNGSNNSSNGSGSNDNGEEVAAATAESTPLVMNELLDEYSGDQTSVMVVNKRMSSLAGRMDTFSGQVDYDFSQL